MNEPKVLDKTLTVEPGLFLGIQTKPPVHERQLRLLKEKIEDIYKVKLATMIRPTVITSMWYISTDSAL
jgi:hypothetical protein